MTEMLNPKALFRDLSVVNNAKDLILFRAKDEIISSTKLGYKKKKKKKKVKESSI